MRKSFQLIEIAIATKLKDVTKKHHESFAAVIEKTGNDAKFASVAEQKEIQVFGFISLCNLVHNDVIRAIGQSLPASYTIAVSGENLISCWEYSTRFVCKNATDEIEIMVSCLQKNVLVILKRDAPQQ